MATTYLFYIGQNNATRKLETRKIERVFNAYVDGYTLQKARGYWKGESEKNAIVSVIGLSKAKALRIAKELKRELKQQSVLIEKRHAEINFI